MSALSSVAALPLIVTPSIAQDGLPACSWPDLATRFESLYALFRRQWDADDRRVAAFEARCFERTGVVFEGYSGGREYPAWYEEARTALAQENNDADPELETWRTLSAEADVLGEEILRLVPKTVADIILQARACALQNNSFWKDRTSVDSMDRGDRAYRLLVDRICQYHGGVGAFPGVATFPMLEVEAVDCLGRPDDVNG